MKLQISLLLAAASIAGCAGSQGKQTANGTTTPETAPTVVFNADSAYAYVQRQCDFGPRVPNSEAHRECGDWMAAELRSRGANVTEQRMKLKAFDGTTLDARNIIAEFYPEKERRVLLLAHWDCRPWADNDPNPDNHRKPVDGANDGASGTGVLLEMARLLQSHEPSIGVDILLVDAEDWGETEGDESSWALGTQHWLQYPHRKGYAMPEYGILLDMVGNADASFKKEYFSLRFASSIVEKIWKTAEQLGYSSKFPDTKGGAITDDHLFVNAAGIPCVDIIDQRTDSQTGFFPQWHTTDDKMTHIDRSTLKAVGQTVATLLFEK